MGDVYKGLTVKLGADVSGLSSALRKARGEVSGVASDLRKVERALKIDPGNTNLLAQQQRDYRKQIESTEKQLKLYKQAEEAALSGDQPLNDEQWTKLQSDIAVCEQKLKGYKRALADSIIQQGVANSALGKTGEKLERIGERFDVVGQKMSAAGSVLTHTVTAGVVAAGVATVAAATKIDTALTGVKKTVDGTEEEYRQLKASAIEFSKTNAVDASQILDIQALGAQLGFAIEELDEFGEVVSGLDIATNMDADTAATEMAQFANITKMSHEEIRNYGSAIVGLGNNFATTESDISSMAMRIAAAGTQVHMSEADILGLATALSSMGIEAEAGGTAISTIMAQIDKDIALNSEAVETWASTAGMSAQDFADACKTDPVQALSALLSNMEAATAEGGNMSVMLQELGIDSIRQTDVMKRLAGNSQFVADAVATANEEWSKNTALQAEVDNRNESLAAKFEILKNKVVALADDVGGPLADALLDIVDQAEPLIKAISEGAKRFADMSESEQQAVLKAVALSAALGPMLNVLGKGASSVTGFGRGLQRLARFFAEVDYKTSSASRGLKTYDGASKASEASAKKQATAVKASSVAMGAAKSAALGIAGVLAGMLLAAIAGIVSELAEADKRSKEVEATNRLLSSSLDGLESGAQSASAALGDYGLTTASVKGRADDLKRAHEDLANSLSDAMTEAGASVGMLDSYMATIEDLGLKSDLGAQEQARLKDALDKVNEACGTSFQMTDDVNGALYGQVDAIRAVVSAQQERLRYEAASEGLKDLYKQQEADLMRIAELEQQRNDLMEKHKGQTRAQWGEDAEVYNELGNALFEARDQYNATGEAVARYEDRVGELGSSLGSANDDIAAFVSQNEALASALEQTGQSADGFSEALAQCGASTSDLASLSSEQLADIARDYDGSIQSIVGKLQEFGIVAKEEGANAAEGLASGLSEGADQAVEAAAEVTGASVEQIRADCSYFGIEGDAAVAAYADSIAKGSSQAEAAAAAAAASGARGADKAQAFVDSASKSMEAYKRRLADTDGANRAASQAASAGARGAGSQGASYQGAGASMLSYFNGVVSKAAGSRSAGVSSAREAASGMQSQTANASTWGSHLVENFAAGIRGMVSWVASAASSVASTVANILGHTVPKTGPLRNNGKGEKEWGEHTVENYESGVRAQIPALKKTMEEVAGIAASGMSAPLSSSARGFGYAGSGTTGIDVVVNVDSDGGLTKSDVYDAVAAAIASSRSDEAAAVYIDGRELTNVFAPRLGVKLGSIERRRSNGL